MGEPAEIATLVVDDSEAFREVMGTLLETTPGFVLAGQVASGEEAIAAVDSIRPRLVLMDVCMPGIGGTEARRTLADLHPEVLVILISVEPPEDLPGDTPFAAKEQLSSSLLRELWDRHGNS